MSKTIDNRVVEMEFDNKRFEKNAKDTIDTLDKLNKSLKLENATDGLKDIQTESGKIDFSGIQAALDNINSKFSAVGIFAITVLQNISQAAINAGKTIISAFTIDPIKTGFQEYETQINSIQTILANTASKGTTLNDVTEALDTLNTYADKTIYNFTEMTRNIGTFTAAGIDLSTATNAIQGIANLAAVSGSTSQQASVAMYQLSQALASGTVKLMDWNSVVNAGMGGQVFQDALKETARVHGIAIDDMIKKEGSFRETLQNGWLTSEILTETLQKFTLTTEGLTDAEIERNREMLKAKGYTDDQIDAIFELGKTATDAATKVKTFTQLWDTLKEAAQSGWTQSWEYIVGDFDEAKESLTAISDYFNDVIGKSAEARNSMLKFWHDNGGRDAAIQAIKNAFQALLSVITPIKEAFRDVFPAMTGERLLAITEAIRDFTATLKLSEPQMENLKNTFRGLFAILDIGVQVFKAIVRVIAPLFGELTTLGDGVLTLTGGIGDYIYKLDEMLKKNDTFYKALKAIVDFIVSIPSKIEDLTGIDFGKIFDTALETVKNFKDNVEEALKGFKDIDTSGVDDFGDKIKEKFRPFEFIGNAFKTIFGGILYIAEKVTPVLFGLAKSVGDAMGKLFDGIGEALSRGDFEAVFDIINGSIFATILLKLKEFVDSLGSVKEITGNVSGILDGVRGSLEAFQSNLKAKTLLTIASAIAILTASLLVLSTIDSKDLTTSLAAITTLFVELFTFMGGFTKLLGPDKLVGIGQLSASLIALSTAVLILSIALKSISKLDWEDLAKGLTGVTVLLAELSVAAKYLTVEKGRIAKGATSLIMLSTAVLILAQAVKSLSDLNWTELEKGLVGVGALLAELVAFLKLADLDGVGVFKATALVILASSLLIMSDAVEKLGRIDTDKLEKGLLSIAAILLEIGVFTKLISGTSKMMTTATGIVILASAMLIFGDAIENIGKLKWEEIAKGLLSIGAGLAAMAIALNKLPFGTLTKSVGLVILASSIEILVHAMTMASKLDWEDIAKGFIAIGGALAILVVALKGMKGTLVGSAALLVATAALNLLVIPLKILGSMSLEEICKGLIALGGALAILGLSAAVLAPVAPAMIAISGAMALLGVALLGIGAGVLAFSAGMSALALSGTAGAAALVASLAMIVGYIPEFVRTLTDGVKAAIEAIIILAPSIGEAAIVLIATLCDVLAQSTPKIVETALTLLEELLSSLVAHAPDIITLATELVLELIYGLEQELPRLVDAGITFIISFIESLADGIYDHADEISDALLDVVESAIYLLSTLLTKIWDKGKQLIEQVKDAWNQKKKAIKDKLIEVVENAIYALATLLTKMWDAAIELGMKFIHAIESLWDKAKEVGAKLATSVVDGISGGIIGGSGSSAIGSNLSGIITSAANTAASTASSAGREVGRNLGLGVANGMDETKSKITASSNFIIETIDKVLRKKGEMRSPSRLTARVGKYLGLGIVMGIKDTYKDISDASEGAIDNLKFDEYEDIRFSPTITPIVDLSDVNASTEYIKGAFDKENLGFSDISNKLAYSTSYEMGSFTADNKEIINELSYLREDVANLNSSMRRMQIVMDSGALVGSIADPMDEALGQISTLKGRSV